MNTQPSPAELERLAKLAEECGEVIQVIGKIITHGYESRHPDGGPTNRELLAKEIGDIRAAVHLMVLNGDVLAYDILMQRISKGHTITRFMSHQTIVTPAAEQDLS